MLYNSKTAPSKRRILIVEDDAAVRSTLQRFAVLSGYEAVWVATGDAGLKFLESNAPDIMLLDLSLPDKDGLALLRELHEKYANVRVVMLAATTDMPKAQVAMSCGASDFLTKPVELGAFKRMMEIHLPKR
jgi:DNA-binding response OmpR family regulator